MEKKAMQGGTSTQNDKTPRVIDQETIKKLQYFLTPYNDKNLPPVLHMSPEEYKIMHDMGWKSFVQSTSAALGCAVVMQFLIRYAFIRKKFYDFKVYGSALVGGNVGYYLSVKQGMEKITTDCPDGQLTNLWNNKEGGPTLRDRSCFRDNMFPFTRKRLSFQYDNRPITRFSEVVQKEVVDLNQTDLTVATPIQAELDDHFRTKMDGFEPTAQRLEEKPRKPHSYSQLRELAQHEQQMMSRTHDLEDQNVKPRLSEDPSVKHKHSEDQSVKSRQVEQAQNIEEEPVLPKRQVRRNQYGDEIE